MINFARGLPSDFALLRIFHPIIADEADEADKKHGCQEEKESDHDENEDRDELNIMKECQFGTRKSARKASACGFQLNSSQLALTSDSDASIFMHFAHSFWN